MPHIVIISGELSGDKLGGKLLDSLSELDDGITYSGVGGEYMNQHRGFSTLFPLKDISYVGILPIIFNLKTIILRMRMLIDHILSNDVDMVICIDAPEFTHRVAKAVKKKKPNIKIINYAIPTVWAWRPRRAKEMKKYFDYGLCIYPFETKVLENLDSIPCTYVGHEAIENIPTYSREDFLIKFNHKKSDIIIGIFPGSRQRAIQRVLSQYLKVVESLPEALKQKIHIYVSGVKSYRKAIEDILDSVSYKVTVLYEIEDKEKLQIASEVALVSHGTMMLELALLRTPIVAISYLSSFENFLVSLLFRSIPSLSNVNLILDEPIVTEFMDNELIVSTLLELLDKNSEMYITQQEGFSKFISKMTVNSEAPSKKAASKVLEILNK